VGSPTRFPSSIIFLAPGFRKRYWVNYHLPDALAPFRLNRISRAIKANEGETAIFCGMPGGGYILSSDYRIHDDKPLENIFAMIETVKRYGKY